ncbi:hypothetical protein QCA50_008463 [Cerrena zonata]|uniref:Uncharacterized protein n=1 Tax=Cerrena zonata TaxID=2478898 RepID=A0AAW0G436_9APHY
MLDLLSELPRNLEELSIFLHVGNQAYVNVISQDFNWDRLMSMIHSFPLIKMVNIVIISNWDDFVEVASRCSQIVLDALHFYNRGEHEVIKVSCVLGDYDDPLSYRNLL